MVDDGSTDKSGAICDRWSEQYSTFYVLHQQNGGLSAARNRGVDLSQGDYITFIDSDDWIAPTYLETLLGLAVSNQSDLVMCGHYRPISYNEAPPKVTQSTVEYNADQYMRALLRIDGNRAIHYAWGKLYKRGIIPQNVFPKGQLNEDVEGSFRIGLNVRHATEISNVLYAYFNNTNSITNKSIGTNYLSLYETWNEVFKYAQSINSEWTGYCLYNMKRADFTMLCQIILRGNEATDLTYREKEKELLSRLRSNLPDLVKGPMVWRRKVLLIIIALFYFMVKKIYRIIH